jgi:acyl-CoA thioester hydrolase
MRTLVRVEGKRIEIRFRDLDPLGHVNQGVYLTYLEEMIDHWFRQALGVEEGEIWDFVAARTAIDYRSELRLADRAVVGTCSLERVGRSSVTLRAELRTDEGRLAAEIEAVLVTWDMTTRSSRPITDAERAKLEAA